MKLFAVGRRYRGDVDEIVDLGGGLRRHVTHEARAVAARIVQDREADARATRMLNRDRHLDGSMDWLEDGRV